MEMVNPLRSERISGGSNDFLNFRARPTVSTRERHQAKNCIRAKLLEVSRQSGRSFFGRIVQYDDAVTISQSREASPKIVSQRIMTGPEPWTSYLTSFEPRTARTHPVSVPAPTKVRRSLRRFISTNTWNLIAVENPT